MTQVADTIREQILRGMWKDWIPSEREVSQTLEVSRNTCRKSLNILSREKLISAVNGRGRRVNQAAVRTVRRTSGQLHSVGVIMPEHIELVRPATVVTINELRRSLLMSGIVLQVYSGFAYFRPHPTRALEKLLSQNKHDCWVLIRSTEFMQKWFVERAIPSVVCGLTYPGIKLPSVDQDYRAVCRHAAGYLISLGHRRLAYFNRRQRGAGDLESEIGFLEGVRSSAHANVEARIVHHEDSRNSVLRLINSPLFADSNRPTGLLITNSYCYLSAVSGLAQRGVRTPRDISIISRDNDTFLQFLEPEPARYVLGPEHMARKLMILIRHALQGSSELRPIRIMPPFVGGASCAPN